MLYDKDERLLYCGGADNFQGLIFPLQGRNVHTSAMNCHLMTGFANQGDIRFDKRYVMLRVKAKQSGSLPGGQGQLEIIVNVDQLSGQPQSQRITLEDPATDPLANLSDIKDSIIKRLHIYEQYGRGSSIQFEFKHSVFGGEFELSEFECDYFARTKKEQRDI